MPIKRDIILVTIYIVGAIVICSFFGYGIEGCVKTRESQKTDTVYVDRVIEIPSISGGGIVERSKPLLRNQPDKEMSQEILLLLAQRDSLTAILNKDSVSVSVFLNEVVPETKDTVSISYDEITAQLQYNIRFAPRTIQVEQITKTITVQEEVGFWEKALYVAGGMALGYTMNGVLR